MVHNVGAMQVYRHQPRKLQARSIYETAYNQAQCQIKNKWSVVCKWQNITEK